MNFIFFYGGIFSQWYRVPFEVDDQTYWSTEQYMMAEKARLFKDYTTLEKIMSTHDPRTQKKLGRQVAGFDVDKWNAVARDIVYRGNYAKFTQNKGLQEVLTEIGKGSVLVEASPTDRLWGIGLSEDHPDIRDQSKWRGVNWLGEVLTKVKNDIIDGITTTEFQWEPNYFKYTEMPPI